LYRSLTSQLSFRSHLAHHSSHFQGKLAELFYHAVNFFGNPGELSTQPVAADLQGHLLRQVALSNGTDNARYFGGWMDEVGYQGIECTNARGPGSADVRNMYTVCELSLSANYLAGMDRFFDEDLITGSDLVEGVANLAVYPFSVDRHTYLPVSVTHLRKYTKQFLIV